MGINTRYISPSYNSQFLLQPPHPLNLKLLLDPSLYHYYYIRNHVPLPNPLSYIPSHSLHHRRSTSLP